MRFTGFLTYHLPYFENGGFDPAIRYSLKKLGQNANRFFTNQSSRNFEKNFFVVSLN